MQRRRHEEYNKNNLKMIISRERARLLAPRETENNLKINKTDCISVEIKKKQQNIENEKEEVAGHSRSIGSSSDSSSKRRKRKT